MNDDKFRLFPRRYRHNTPIQGAFDILVWFIGGLMTLVLIITAIALTIK